MSIFWNYVVSAHGAAPTYDGEFPGSLVLFFLYLIIRCLPVHGNHEHVQGCNPTTTTSFPGRHISNNKNSDKRNKNLG